MKLRPEFIYGPGPLPAERPRWAYRAVAAPSGQAPATLPWTRLSLVGRARPISPPPRCRTP